MTIPSGGTPRSTFPTTPQAANTAATTDVQTAQESAPPDDTQDVSDAAPAADPKVTPQQVGGETRRGDLAMQGSMLQAQVSARLAVTAHPDPPNAAALSRAYKASAAADVANPKTIEFLNKELKAANSKAAPLTVKEAQDLIKNTDVKVLSKQDYYDLKSATGGSPVNPATTLTAESRQAIKDSGPENLARRRIINASPGADKNTLPAPTDAQIAQARKDLEAIDPGIFKDPSKDVIYVNAGNAENRADPTKSKVASHEYTHVLLNHRDFGPESKQHEVLSRMGWNPSERGPGAANYDTAPGKGIP